MNNSVLAVTDYTNDNDIWFDNKDAYYKAIIENEKDVELEAPDIIVNNKRELEVLLLSLGNNVTPIIDTKNEITYRAYKDLFADLNEKNTSESFEWNYRNPQEAHNIVTRISMPDYIRDNLSGDISPISKEYVHKLNQNNVLISYPERFGNMLYFRGFKEAEELKSDHNSDHLDGIKLFEVVRQSTLASFHVMGVPIGKIMVLTSTRLDFSKLIELDKPYFVQVIPACKTDGGAMFTAFNVIQEGKSHANGYIGAYTFRSKEAYQSKRLG
ncbi:AfsA-related hotdog domain-containing protein [Clostridium sp.]|uniref:AfsA-related hotdog domain-containing protein n=1 Tax=Clostridium sp. TaxID=1506 RepID=UPI00262C4389|nr:AfsA-related hotdog domain-containing protein [Clostridium sp.]